MQPSTETGPEPPVDLPEGRLGVVGEVPLVWGKIRTPDLGPWRGRLGLTSTVTRAP